MLLPWGSEGEEGKGEGPRRVTWTRMSQHGTAQAPCTPQNCPQNCPILTTNTSCTWFLSTNSSPSRAALPGTLLWVMESLEMIPNEPQLEQGWEKGQSLLVPVSPTCKTSPFGHLWGCQGFQPYYFTLSLKIPIFLGVCVPCPVCCNDQASSFLSHLWGMLRHSSLKIKTSLWAGFEYFFYFFEGVWDDGWVGGLDSNQLNKLSWALKVKLQARQEDLHGGTKKNLKKIF